MHRVAMVIGALALVAACSSGSSSSPVVPAGSSAVSTAPAAATTAPAPGATTAPAPGTTTAPAPGASTAPEGDAFYTPPDPLPAGQPGDIIWSRPFTGPGGSQGHEVLYLSRTVADQPVAVSGVVIVPGAGAAPAPAEGRTVLSWAHGTTGLGDACAPSRQYAAGNAGEILLAQLAVGRGFVYTATDYQGLGPPGDHPFVVGLSEGRNVLDAARAAERLSGSGAAATSKVLLWGHSQGGGAALFAAEMAPAYAPDLNVVGAIAGAPAAELATVAAANDGGPNAGFNLMALVGFHAAYPTLSYDAILNDAGRQAVDAIDGECSNDINRAYGGTHLADFVTTDPATAPGWSDAYAANEPGQTATPVPIFLYQGDADQVIPVAVSQTLLQKYCALGVPVARKTYPNADHTSVIPAAVVDILAFVNDRVAGTPFVATCG
jgi:alpha-beta hydrolase superfamily lysophospholipase